MERREPAPDLTPIPLDDGGSLVERPRLTPATVVTWGRVAAAALGLVATVALLLIAWGQLQQERLLRHQQCINDAQILFSFNGQANPVAIDRALARCYGNPRAFLAQQQQIVVPGFVSVHLGDAKRDIAAAGLVIGAVHGPTTDNSLITDQEPKGGVSVPEGTSLDVWTKSG